MGILGFRNEMGIAQVTAVAPAEGQSLCPWGARRNATLEPMPPCGVLTGVIIG
jgi:hypothetical protein